MITIADITPKDSQWLSENLKVLSTGIEKLNHKITPFDIEAIPSKGVCEQLAFNIILINLASQKKLAETQIGGYQNLVSPYLLPEIELFQYEIHLAKEGKDKAAQVHKELIQKYPSMEYWLNQAEKELGYINLLKSMRIDSIEKNAGLVDSN